MGGLGGRRSRWSLGLAGVVAGEGEEDLVERGLLHGDRVDGICCSRRPTSTSTAWSLRWRAMFIRRASGVSTGSSPSTRSTTRAAAGMSSAETSCSCRVERPTEDFSSSEVPSATFRPWSMTAIRSASWSASSRYCVVSRMVLPCCTSSRMVVHIWPRVRGSRPVVGSSRKISGGRVIRLAARSSRRRMPPENWAICLVAASSSPNCVEQPLGGLARRRPAQSLEAAEEEQVLGGGQVLVDRGVLPGDAEELADDVRVACVRRPRRCCASPPSIGSRVASILSMVVLPAPLGPRTPNTSPRCTVRSTPSTARWSPKLLDQAVRLDGGRRGARGGVEVLCRHVPKSAARPVSRQFHGDSPTFTAGPETSPRPSVVHRFVHRTSSSCASTARRYTHPIPRFG